MHQNPCPATGRTSGACPGYVVDHIKPLKRGGADRPWNMQWQTKAESKAKDAWEYLHGGAMGEKFLWNGAPCWDRTSDPHRVKVVLYR